MSAPLLPVPKSVNFPLAPAATATRPKPMFQTPDLIVKSVARLWRLPSAPRGGVGGETPPDRPQSLRAKDNIVGRQAERAPAELEHFRAMLTAYMTKKGLRSTDQRRLIVETFFRSDNHVSIEELLAQVRAKDRRVGYATVYRTLKLLAECGVAYERRFGDGLTRYELADDVAHHDHLICVACGTITEFEEPHIEELQERVARKYDFELRTHKHELYGICSSCRSNAQN